MATHVVPPMRFATEACEVVEQAVLHGMPVQLISAGQMGATSPVTIAGSLVQALCESLAGVTFAWLVEPHARIVFAPKPLVSDLRTGAMCGGSGEQAVLMASAAQMGRFYGLPTSSIAGYTDSKIHDAQGRLREKSFSYPGGPRGLQHHHPFLRHPGQHARLLTGKLRYRQRYAGRGAAQSPRTGNQP